uniref:HAT C-terminal dimerisation domain-containing protein n=1 Tax=Sinocyclocheilus anshuiensis TaxID=1608454 RepID=A0A671QLV8_9TELE
MASVAPPRPALVDKEHSRSPKDTSKPICKSCYRAVLTKGANTSNLAKHLKDRHPDLYKEFSRALFSRVMHARLCAWIGELPAVWYSSNEAKKLKRAVAVYISMDQVPVYTVEKPRFKQLLEHLNNRYALPSRNFFMYTEIPALYNETKEIVMNRLGRKTFYSCTTDLWTSRATSTFMAVTLQFVTETWDMQSWCLGCIGLNSEHTAECLREALEEMIQEAWKLDMSYMAVTDNASNMSVAAEIAKLVHVRCFAHCLNLAAQWALKLPTVSHLLGRVRSITTFFRKSTITCHVLHEKQKLLGLPEHKLMTDVCTRWNSAHDMLERFVEQQPAIWAALLSAEEQKNAKDLWTLTEADIACAEDVINALKPLKLARHVMSDEKAPTVSIIIAVAGDLEKRYEREMPFLNMTSALDPRFKALPFLEEENRQHVYTKMAMEASQTSLARKVDACALEDLFGDSDFPLLSNLASCTLCIPGTSVAAERVFSTAGDIITAKRRALKPEHVDQLLFLHKNMKL